MRGRMWTARLRSNATRHTPVRMECIASMRTTATSVSQEERGLGPCATTALFGTARLRIRSRRRASSVVLGRHRIQGARAVQTVLGRPHRRLALCARSARRVRSWTRVAKAVSDATLGSSQTQVEMGAMTVLVRRSRHLGSRAKSARGPMSWTAADRHASRVKWGRSRTRRETGVMTAVVTHTRNLAHCVKSVLHRMK